MFDVVVDWLWYVVNDCPTGSYHTKKSATNCPETGSGADGMKCANIKSLPQICSLTFIAHRTHWFSISAHIANNCVWILSGLVFFQFKILQRFIKTFYIYLRRPSVFWRIMLLYVIACWVEWSTVIESVQFPNKRIYRNTAKQQAPRARWVCIYEIASTTETNRHTHARTRKIFLKLNHR